MPGMIRNVQALRGIACLVVLLFHIHEWDVKYGANTPVLNWIHWFGFAAVDLFFVMSGFIIAHTNRKNLGRPAAVPGDLLRRLWRTYPTYWTAMLLCAAATTLLAGFPQGWQIPLRRWAEIITLAPPGNLANVVVGQAWTLTYEVTFYLAFGALMVLPPRLAAAGLVAWAALAALAGPPRDPLAWSPVSPFMLEFLAGCLVAYATGRGATGGRWIAVVLAVAWAVAGIVAVRLTAGETYLGTASQPRMRVMMFGVPAALVVYAAVAAEARSKWRPPQWTLTTGDASYSIYLTHGMVLSFAVILGAHIPHSRWPHLGWLAGTLAACLAVGLACYYAVERPLMLLGRRRRPGPAGVVAMPAVPAEPLRKAG